MDREKLMQSAQDRHLRSIGTPINEACQIKLKLLQLTHLLGTRRGI
jgi:hypothetical protein